MSTNKKQPLYNAGEIIERFGGIRPMAAKIDTPVTTVQGWKKRDVIPAARRAMILEAATNNNVNIDDLATATESTGVSSETSNVRSAPSKPKATKKAKAAKKTSVKSTTTKTQAKTDKTTKEVKEATTNPKTSAPVPSAGITASSDEQTKTPSPDNSNNVSTNIWITTGLILLGLALALYFIVPKLKASDTVIEAQSQKLVELEQEIDETRGLTEAVQETAKVTAEVATKEGTNTEGFFGASLPENLEEKIDNLQNQTRNISVTVDQLTEKAKKLSEETYEKSTDQISIQKDKVTAKVQDFEKKIEEKMSSLALPDVTTPKLAFDALVKKIDIMKASETGMSTLSQAAQELAGLVKTADSEDITTTLEQAQKEESALSQTILGVPKNDLKAAAMLIAFSQFRSSLEREEAFDQDLQLLQNLVGNKSPDLNDNIKRLSAHANGGVLTSQGLSSALKKTAADIVVSSLKGENVSIKEKAKARFGDLVQVEKDGVSLTGTETQKTLSKAQEALDAGKLENSIVLLETLEGEAAQSAQPVIEQAKSTLLANQTVTMLEQQIFSPDEADAQSTTTTPEENSKEQKSTKFDLSKENVFIVPKSDTMLVLE